ncbi:unnamed protein product [Strongylus vulgaris]|uniref:EGF-like domain-containing protein n=1 Tax=Strongylus vulgaris TaxID=40348 RepID=A0A3P7K0S8_STRVU|nr:unnamed protein product [Strongylus vulgaris]
MRLLLVLLVLGALAAAELTGHDIVRHGGAILRALKMRLLLVLLVLGALAAAELTGHDIVRHVIKSWNPNRRIKTVQEDEGHTSLSAATDRHVRSKRSVAASSYISASKSCNMPGYTGEFCEFRMFDN